MKRSSFQILSATLLGTAVLAAEPAPADDVAADVNKPELQRLAKMLENPMANLINVPIQNNWDFGIGPAKAMRNRTIRWRLSMRSKSTATRSPTWASPGSAFLAWPCPM